MSSFEHFWALLSTHGVIPNKWHEAEELWGTFTLEQQRQIYRVVRDKIRARKFVNYNPVIAIMNNAPQTTRAEPVNYNGKNIPAGVQVFSAKYKGSWGMYTQADIERFGMEKAG